MMAYGHGALRSVEYDPERPPRLPPADRRRQLHIAAAWGCLALAGIGGGRIGLMAGGQFVVAGGIVLPLAGLGLFRLSSLLGGRGTRKWGANKTTGRRGGGWGGACPSA